MSVYKDLEKSTNVKLMLYYRTGSLQQINGAATITKIGAPVLTKSGMLFNGSLSNYFRLGNDSNLELNNFTYIVKVSRNTDSGSFNVPIAIQNSAGGGVFCGWYCRFTTTFFQIVIAKNVTTEERLTTTMVFEKRKDYNIAFVKNGTSLKLFVNGNLLQEVTLTFTDIYYDNVKYSFIGGFSTLGSSSPVGATMDGNIKFMCYTSDILSSTEIQHLTAELEQAVDQRVSSKAIETHDGVKGDGSTVDAVIDYGHILPMGTSDLKIEANVLMPRNVDWSTGATLWAIAGRGFVGLAEGRFYFLIFNNLISFVVEFKSSVIFTVNAPLAASSYNGQQLKLTANVNRSDKVYFTVNGATVASVSISAYSSQDVQGTLNFTVGGVSSGVSTKLPFPGKISDVKVWRNNVLEFHAPCYTPASLKDNVGKIVPVYSSSVFTFDGVKNIVTPEIYFKGELGAIANETTISSGFLENLDARILSGSFKVTTTKVNGLLRKNIVCVTDGSLYFTKMNPSLSGVSRYIDGVRSTTDLASARTISLTAGQTMIYWCEDESMSFYQVVE